MPRFVCAAMLLACACCSIFALPVKSTTTVTTYERPGRPGQLWIDQEIDAKVSPDWTLMAGAEYAAATNWTFLQTPEKAGGRLGAVTVLPAGMYLDGFLGVASWFTDGSPSTTSAVLEGAWNAEGAVWYLGLRDRLLLNSTSLVSIATLRGKWYPSPLFMADAKAMLAGESGLGLSPSGLIEITISPFESYRPFFFGANGGGTYYARSFAEGGGYGTEGSLAAILGARDEPGYSARLTLTRRFGGRSSDRWELEAVFVKQID